MQLHRTDAGTYVCVAYNGIGNTVEREISLTVNGKSLMLLLWCWMKLHELIRIIGKFGIEICLVLEYEKKKSFQ